MPAVPAGAAGGFGAEPGAGNTASDTAGDTAGDTVGDTAAEQDTGAGAGAGTGTAADTGAGTGAGAEKAAGAAADAVRTPAGLPRRRSRRRSPDAPRSRQPQPWERQYHTGTGEATGTAGHPAPLPTRPWSPEAAGASVADVVSGTRRGRAELENTPQTDEREEGR